MSVDDDDISDRDDQSLVVFNKARDEMDAGRIETAIKLFEQSNRLSPHYKTCLLLGECLVRLARCREAIIPLAAATALNRQGIAPTLLAEAFLAVNDPGKAHEFAKLALERQPHYKKAQDFEPIARAANERRMREMFGE